MSGNVGWAKARLRAVPTRYSVVTVKAQSSSIICSVGTLRFAHPTFLQRGAPK
jgi:hypothetical protein